MAQQPPLLRDVIDIKERVSTSDYVLQLSEATTPEGAVHALRDYVVTERLLENFDEALSLIRAALDGHTSKAAYLHGSFGSGKSHFMAVLHALLSGSPAVRERGDFDPVLTKHEWLAADGKRFLLVPYHMLGAKALEQRVLGGYVTHVKRLHPDAPTPQVYRTDALFTDIRSMRSRMGDAAVIAGLASEDGDGGEDDEWGESFAWTPTLLDGALAAEEVHESGQALNLVSPSTPAELRARLVQDASANLLPGFAKLAGDLKAISRAILNSFGIVAMLAIPAGAGICAVAPFLVPVVLGEKWISGVPVMELLSINSAINVFHASTATALIATGNPFAATRVNMVFVAVMIPGIILLAHKFGPIGAAYAVFIASIICTPIYLWQLRRYAGVGYKDWLRVVMRPAIASAAMVSIVRMVSPHYVLGMASSHAGLILVADVVIGATFYLVAILSLWSLMGRPDGAERQVLSRVSSRIPSWIPIPGR